MKTTMRQNSPGKRVKRAKTHEEIKPLIQLCKAGKLFDVQAWIAAGKPVNPPKPPMKGTRMRSPLQYAIDSGFHSLVHVLLEAGVEIEHSWKYSDLSHALWARQFEIVKLLVEYGADVQTINMSDVFSSWEPGLMEYFIERGADVDTGNPLAKAFCNRIRTALRIYKQYKDRFPSFQEQANIALRHHCAEGNLKWVSLMLWLGADPYAPGPDDPEDESHEWDHNGLELAALYGRDEVFGLRIVRIRLGPKYERAEKLMRMVCRYGKNADLLKRFLDIGYSATDQANGGSSHVEALLSHMNWSSLCTQDHIDTDESREKLKMLHMLMQHGARWIPMNPSEMKEIRQSLRRMTPDYTMEVIWIMAKYGGCTQQVIDELLKTPTMCAHILSHTIRINELVARLPEELPK